MPCDYRKYPANWREIRASVMARAGNKCEGCGAYQHAVGYRDEGGAFIPNAGNLHCDASGRGRHPNGFPLTYAEAREFVEQYHDCSRTESGPCTMDADGNHWLVIVLTIAHLDHDTTHNDPENLRALCQRCHNRHDVAYRRANASATRANRYGAQQPELETQR